MAGHRRQRFWSRRFHDASALLLLLVMWGWLHPHHAPPIHWSARIGYGYIERFESFDDDWRFKTRFMTQGVRPFHVALGGEWGPFEARVISNGTRRRWCMQVPRWSLAAL